ncbi:NADPH:quinone oxidoreductase family protein [Marivibrio halodurans]|uniref:NADPH:quinone oxidoreductase family protein n=1 Tax=Marivibrio halodurans TaxID=2039722 RepID=A0A8J7S1I0_9PROT|nr:NADPH:quinone oxidoreductase family protein [Marivibrio halodurans]MBP5858632.1 NADPH:quinone oxidoreductase family protein [Marivibrio halodurans]
MRALRVTGTEGLSSLALDEIAPPGEPGEGEVLIDVAAGALNFADLLMLQGRYQEMPAPPFTAGLELSGVVAAVGPKVDGVFVGDRVAAHAGHGAFAERAIVKDHACLNLPPDRDLATAAALPVAFGTAHVALTHRARLRAGELLLVTGAGGGVGLAAVALGRALGATVIAAASGPEKLAVAERYGAAFTIDYEREDLRARVKAIAADHGRTGCDVLFDPVGGALFETAMRCVGFEARLIVIGFAAGDIQKIPANLLLVKNIDVVGFYWGAYAARDPNIHRESFRALHGVIEADGLSPHIGARFPLAEAAEGYRLLESRQAAGKILIDIADIR